MARTIVQQRIIEALSALDAQSKLGWEVLKAENITFVVVFSAGTSAGTVVIEGAHDKNFTGVWANLATIAWAAENRAHVFNISGNHMAIRARISVAIVGGTVDVYVNVTG